MFFVFSDTTKPEKKTSTVEILRTGKWVYGGREITFTEEDLNHIVENFKNGVRPEPPTKMVVDYNHGSLDTEPEKSKAAGWVKDLFVEDGSLKATIEWTPTAVKYIMNDEFKYTSAEIDPDYTTKKDGKNVGITLLAIALTNRPFIEGQEDITLAEAELKKKAEKRSKKYGIHIRQDGHLTIPKEYSDCPESEFADPVNYMYPLNTEERAMAAYKYFSQNKNRSFYSKEEQKKIEARIKKHLPAKIKKNAFKGGEMDDEKVIKLTEELKKKEDNIVKLTEENKKLKEQLAEKDKALAMSEANEWVNKMLNEKFILAKEKEMFTEMYVKDREFAKKFTETRGKILPEGATGSSEGDKNAGDTVNMINKIADYAKENNMTFGEARIEMLKRKLI
jgi:hypothetical protein